MTQSRIEVPIPQPEPEPHVQLAPARVALATVFKEVGNRAANCLYSHSRGV